jgi:phage gp37-like protein
MNFEDIEDKIINEIKTQITSFKTIETYAGQLEQDLDMLPIQFPAAYVVYGGSDYEWIDGPNHNETCTFSILVAAKSLRGQKSVRKDDNGAYQMVNLILQALINKNFGLSMERLKPVKVSLVFISKTAAIYGVDFQTNFDTTFNW